ncbi:MAG: DoxX family protein [Gammaproteobacteria bacterium]
MKISRTTLAQWSPLPLRLIVGYGFVMHGYLKLERGVDVFAAALDGIGVPFSHLMAWVTTVIELLGGLAILLGAYVPLASVPMAIVLLVAMVKVHWQFGFSSIKFLSATPAGLQFGKPGVECDLLYLACLCALVASGAGPLTFDGWRHARRLQRAPNTKC